jgi:hypothetical protein
MSTATPHNRTYNAVPGVQAHSQLETSAFLTPAASLDKLEEVVTAMGQIDICNMVEAEGVWDSCRPKPSVPGVSAYTDSSDDSSDGDCWDDEIDADVC